MLLCLSDTLDFSKVKFLQVKSISVRTDQDHNTCNITDMCLVSDDRMVMADGVNRSIKLVDLTTGRILHRLELEDCPFGVCKMFGDRVAVTLLAGMIKVPLFIMNI